MNFLIITHTVHKMQQDKMFAYEPYVREMNIWLKYVDEVLVIAPKSKLKPSQIQTAYKHENIKLNEIPSIQFTSIKHVLLSLINLPIIVWSIFIACQKADHIHLRCPGNIGLLGCFIQVLFPKKTKTAKYAGNWDPKAKQPLSYKLQKWILSNTLLTKNISVLVYGHWKYQSKNIQSFFTASFLDSETKVLKFRDYSNTLKFLFVGSLVRGKRPLFAIQIIKGLNEQGKKVHLDIYGDGVLKKEIQQYIVGNKLEDLVTLKGNQSKAVIKQALEDAHFLILPSKSEGWPKAIAEAMFFGTIPIATRVSCVPDMLGFGDRGILIEANLESDINVIKVAINNAKKLKSMSKKALKWSQSYTLDVFEKEVSKLLE